MAVTVAAHPPHRVTAVCFIPSAGCFFGDEVRGGGDSAPSDSDASSEVEKLGPEHPLSVEPGDTSRSAGPGPSRTEAGAVQDTCLAQGSGEAAQVSGLHRQPGPAELPWTNIDLKEPPKGPSCPAASFPQPTGLCSLGLLGMEEPCGAADHPLWAWVSGGGCAVEAGCVLKWFSVQSGLSPSVQTLSLSITPAQTAAWRKQIFQQLTERTKRELENFRHYEQAVEQVRAGPGACRPVSRGLEGRGRRTSRPPLAQGRTVNSFPSYLAWHQDSRLPQRPPGTHRSREVTGQPHSCVQLHSLPARGGGPSFDSLCACRWSSRGPSSRLSFPLENTS